MNVSIVIPAFNEAENLEFVVEDCVRTLDELPGEHEIVLVDDASTDGSPAILGTLAAQHPRLRVLRNAENLGCHPSARRGLDEARGDWLLFLPADRQIRADSLHRFLGKTGEADMVCSYRRNRADPPHRVLIGRLYNAIVRVVTGVPFRDFDSSVLIRREAYREVAPQLVANSASLAVELVMRVLTAGYRVGEVEIEHYPRVAGRATGLNGRDVLRVPRNLLRTAGIAYRARRARPGVRVGSEVAVHHSLPR